MRARMGASSTVEHSQVDFMLNESVQKLAKSLHRSNIWSSYLENIVLRHGIINKQKRKKKMGDDSSTLSPIHVSQKQ